MLALFFGWALPLPTQAIAQPTAVAAQLAARISSLLPRPSTVSLEIQDLTSSLANERSNFRILLQDELRKLGIATTAAQPESGLPLASSRVRITLSEDVRGLLFVAEVWSGDNRQVAILPWAPAPLARANPRVSIAKKPLWTQLNPILDILLTDSDSEMLVLSTDNVSSYRWMGDKWTPTATATLVLSRPMPRDPRGRLEATAGGFEAFLPVATCTGAWNPELELTCANGTANWHGTVGTHWLADRNVLEGETPNPSFEGWGSDWASVADPCGAGTVVIASSQNTEHDSVRAYLIRDGQANPVSDPLPQPGPVTALWPAESTRQATLVVHNLQTGNYEASRLGLACTE